MSYCGGARSATPPSAAGNGSAPAHNPRDENGSMFDRLCTSLVGFVTSADEVSVEPAAAAASSLGMGQSMKGGQLSVRSEEHTSELQSLMRISYAVFCLK